jgi:hypothetical protein
MFNISKKTVCQTFNEGFEFHIELKEPLEHRMSIEAKTFCEES